MDMPEADENLQAFKENLDDDIPVYPISSITKEGLTVLLYRIADELDSIPKAAIIEEQVIIQPKQVESPFDVSRDDDGAFVLSGAEIERLFKMTDFTSDEGVQRFARRLRHMGVDEALRKRGAKDGDTVRLLDFEFEFID